MEEIKSPNIGFNTNNTTIFFAGTIENGNSINWQKDLYDKLSKIESNITVFNPRRDNWDSSWEQSIKDVRFKEQVDWELYHIEISDLVIFYFHPGTMSPISLLELGICSQIDKQIIVCCPDGFYRKGNVDIVCDRYKSKYNKILNVDTLDDLYKILKNVVRSFT